VPSPDVAVVGAGIVGCALAAFLAEAGASVLLVEREEVAAGASGRNSGIVQHPMDAELVPLFEETVDHYRELAEHGFALPDEPSGVLVLAEDPADLAHELALLQRDFPELQAEALAPGEPAALEPGVARRLAGMRMNTGHTVPPAAATRAFAARAAAAGARVVTGAAAVLAPGGLTVDGAHVPAGRVAVAAGPWTPEVVDPSGGWRPIVPRWGVVAGLRLTAPPRHSVEEVGVEQLLRPGAEPPPIFSLITAGAASSLGSTFSAQRPDPVAMTPRLVERGARFMPGLANAPVESVRCCARPVSEDGRPLLGRAPGRADVFVAAGHGPWGISLGPASARRVAELMLGGDAAGPPAAFDPARFPLPQLRTRAP
jgi:glycine/D-amino acid oxidase-like deaminating enzyme